MHHNYYSKQKNNNFSLKIFWGKIKPHPLLPFWQRLFRWALIFGGTGFLAGIIIFILSLIIFSFGLPKINEDDLLQAQSTIIMDREGNILYAIHGEENRKIVNIDEISPYLLDATIAIEDDQFYDHFGFDIPCLAKAVAYETFGIGIRRGCSTITQQLAKNLFLNPTQTYKRKIQELVLAVKMEIFFKKEDILKLYLNEIPYGNNAYGSELAAQTYFSKPAKDLTLTEASILAALPKAPTRYSPYGNNRYSHLTIEFTEEQLQKRPLKSTEDLNYEEYVRGLIGANISLADGSTLYIPGRVDLVLNAMLTQGKITQEEMEMARTESWSIEFKRYHGNAKAMHFVLYVKELLEEKYGKEVIEQGGLKVYTTLDPRMQELAEKAIANQRDKNFTQYNATNASLITIQPQTGQILAMVGSADYWDESIDGNVNIALRYRQPGSSFKPFVYALSFLNGYNPATVLYDVATQFGPGQWPKNYDGTFRGPTSIRRALAQSRNIPAIKAYFLAGQEEAIIPFVKQFGINLDSSIGYGWPLALGSGEVRLIDMVGAYSVFANTGIKKTTSPILKIENSDGKILEQWQDEVGTQVLDPQVAYLINDILSDTANNLGPALNLKNQITAIKTGTSNKKDEKGAYFPNNTWAIGYSTKLVTGVWVGNADGSGMNYYADGYNCATPIWNAFMTEALTDMPIENFPKPTGIVEITVSKATGLLPSENTTETTVEKFASFSIPTTIEDRYVTMDIDSKTGLIANPYSPSWSLQKKTFFIHQSIIPSYTYWQAGIDAWALKTEGIEKPPTETDTLHTAETLANAPSIIITNPTSYSAIEAGSINIEVEINAPNGIEKVEFYLGDILQFISVNPPYSGTIRIPINNKIGAQYEITAYIYDQLGYRNVSTVPVQIKSPASTGDTSS